MRLHEERGFTVVLLCVLSEVNTVIRLRKWALSAKCGQSDLLCVCISLSLSLYLCILRYFNGYIVETTYAEKQFFLYSKKHLYELGNKSFPAHLSHLLVANVSLVLASYKRSLKEPSCQHVRAPLALLKQQNLCFNTEFALGWTSLLCSQLKSAQ